MDYHEALEWLYGTQQFGFKLGLEGPKELLKKFLAYPAYGTKVLHVAGTNGKGSVCAMMEMLIRGAGHRSALFTSPHLVDFRERIRVNSMMISEEECALYLTKLRHLAEGMATHPTFFELTLALAMRYFKDQGAEYIVLETGMGGRLDATTAVPADVCVITPIGMDHSEYLGDSLEEIAMEKAGIMVEGVPVICAGQAEEVKQVLEEEANMRRCPITMIEEPLVGYSVGIPGPHQKYNANVAVHAVHEVGLHLTYDTVKECLEHVKWPGRFENVGDDTYPIVLDGAHNPQAANALVETWKESFQERKAVLIFGAVEEKDVKGVLSCFSEIIQEVIFTPISSPRALSTDRLLESIEKGIEVRAAKDLKEAWQWAKETKEPVLIAGSLFLVGEVKAMLEGEGYQSSSQ